MALKIKDIAKKAGVSITAVSFALNNKEGISDETRKKILDIVSECGYTPRTLIKFDEIDQLQQANTSKLILLLNCPSTPFTKVESGNVSLSFYEIIKEVERSANQNQYDLVFKSINMDSSFQEEVHKIVTNYHVAGIIVASTAIPSFYIKQVQELGVPVVAIDSYYSDINVDCVVMDNYAGAYAAGKYLIELGHKKIGYLKSVARVNNFDERQKGFEAALNECGIDLDPANIYQVGSTIEDCETGLSEALTEKRYLPTALFAESDYLAVGALKSLQGLGIKVPDDVSVIGFDNIAISELMTPKLTTVSVPWGDMADMAIETLMRQIRQEGKTNLKTRIGVELIKRESCRVVK